GQMLSTASAVGHGGMLEMGTYYFLTDYLPIGPKINLNYVSVNDIKETNYTVSSDVYKEYNKFGISLGVALNYFYYTNINMKFFIDTANVDQIKEAQELGILDGVTTNPSLMAKEGITGKDNILKHYVDICQIVDGDVSAEV